MSAWSYIGQFCALVVFTGSCIAGPVHWSPEHERSIDLRDHGIRISLWEEADPETGARWTAYRISRAGKEIVSRRVVQPAILLKNGAFDPLVREPAFRAELAADPRLNEIHIVQFLTQPLDAYREDLSALGARIYKYLPNQAYVVRMDESARAQVEALPYVRWVGPYHPAYRIDASLLAPLDSDGVNGAATDLSWSYHIQVFEPGPTQKSAVAQRVREMGGRIDELVARGHLLRATLSRDQLVAVARMNEVAFIDQWGPAGADMDIVREISGANFVETVLGFTGQDVRGEALDLGVRWSHEVFQDHLPLLHGNQCDPSAHGTGVASILWARDNGFPAARGLLPDGQPIVACWSFASTIRRQMTEQLVDPNGPYRTVFQSASVGSARTRSYTTVSAELDDIIFRTDLLVTQSFPLGGDIQSRPEAWAKNVVTVGGIMHQNTLSRADDCWCLGGAQGPAEDGRIKPDMTHFADSIFAAGNLCDTCYQQFGGTSAASPIVAGHFGLFFQMWSAGVFPGFGSPASVFDDRPHQSTARAMLLNTAYRYPFSGAGHDMARMHQGWGNPDLIQLYDARNRTFVVNESDLLKNRESISYSVVVLPDESVLAATLVYTDPMGVVGATKHRINDLTLRAMDPNGVVYWGNVGLQDGNWSQPGGSADTLNTIELILVRDPQPGLWSIEIIASEINEDGHLETPEVDADFALVVRGVIAPTDFLLEVGPIVAGQVARARVTGANPGKRIYLFAGLPGPGTTPVPALNVVLSLENARLAGSAMVDPDGKALLQQRVPPGVNRRILWFQAAQAGTTSNVVSEPLQP